MWHRTLVPAEDPSGGWVQVERAARPIQLLILFGLGGEVFDAYRHGEPFVGTGVPPAK
jgi:hypothetical protein